MLSLGLPGERRFTSDLEDLKFNQWKIIHAFINQSAFTLQGLFHDDPETDPLLKVNILYMQYWRCIRRTSQDETSLEELSDVALR